MEEAMIIRLDMMNDHLHDLVKRAEQLSTVAIDELRRLRQVIDEANKRFVSEVHMYMEKSRNVLAERIGVYTRTQLQAEEWIASLEASIREFSAESSHQVTAKLPKLSLPTFKGDMLQWSEFWDRFQTNIDAKNLPEAEKLAYLIGCLEGDALQAVAGLSITHANYQVAVSTLRERYGDQQYVIDAHYEAVQIMPRAAHTMGECRSTLNNIERHLRVLESLGEPIEGNQFRSLVKSKFPEKMIYELHLLAKDTNLKEIRKGLNTIITAMEITKGDTSTAPSSSQPKITTEALQVRTEPRGKGTQSRKGENHRRTPRTNLKRNHTGHSHATVTQSKRCKKACIFCQGDHYNAECPTVKTLGDRKKKLGRRCYRCFKEGHRAGACPVKRTCYQCKGEHNQALCPTNVNGRNTQNDIVLSNDNLYKVPFSLLQTAVVKVQCPGSNKIKQCRVLLDSGSQRSYITTLLANCLDLPTVKEDLLMIYVFGADKPVETMSPSTEIEIETRRKIRRRIQVNVVQHITDRILPPLTSQEPCVDIMADDGSAGESIDVLIGNDYYFSFLRNTILQVQDNLFLADTDFGWMVTGRTSEQEKENTLSVMTYCQCQEPNSLYFMAPDLPLHVPDMRFLWALESIGITDSPKATREEETVNHFNETVRYEDQRYQVKWPWISFPPELPTNYGLARGRLTGLAKRLDQETRKEYDNILQEQLQAGIIEVLEPQPKEIRQNTPPIHYLPHHMVKQEGKRGRIVYDASARLRDEKSLNECMYRGPSMLEDLTALLLRFRMNAIGITADVEKAFLQVGLQTEDRDVTRFLWLKDINKEASEDNILHLRFCRVPFGIISSPFLLTATIRYHLSKKDDKLLNEIADKCYVDNLVTGADTLVNARDLVNRTRSSFNELSMNIREWTSNSKQLMKGIPKQYRGKEEENVKVLGLTWNIQTDTLKLRLNVNLLNPENNANKRTKREILRTLASLYDPCGFAAPLTLPSKLLLQELWRRKVKWDSTLPSDLEERCESATGALLAAKDIEIPRFVGTINPAETEYELHSFTDASKDSFAAVVYLVICDKKHRSRKTLFIMAKLRVTPITHNENLKIPRLELLGYVIGKRLLMYVKNALQIPVKRICLWTDSGIVLHWMKSGKLLPPFVARRISEIKQAKEIEPRYVNTEVNPADLATRPELWLQKKELWFDGPQFLLKEESFWPVLPEGEPSALLVAPEGLDVDKSNEATVMESGELMSDLETEPMVVTEIGTNHMEDGDVILDEGHSLDKIKKLQELHFPDEVNGKVTHLSRNLKLFMDMEGVLRCRGRIMNTVCSYDTKYPIIIPRDCELTDRLIHDTHERNHHVGASHTLSIIRQRYWIPQGKAKVQRIIRKCTRCVKHGGGPYQLPPTPALPIERANYSAPFTYTGMDYFGPIYVGRSDRQEKRWICLYTCLAVRAVHMEVVNDLTAEECVLALRRFISSRGVPELIVSDNALQFKLTAEILSSNYCLENKIRWKFIPQLSPWHGGFYERLVGLVKNCLKRTLEKQILSDTQLSTIIKEVEAVTNSRPLTCVGSDIEYVLKPADFLTFGKCITITPSQENLHPGGTVTKQSLVESWKRGQCILQEFKRMFVGQYLYSLRERYQHSHKQPRVKAHNPPNVGDIVQIRGESKNRENWRVGKIISLPKGADGLCRVAKVLVEGTEFIRSIGHLYPLEVDEERNSSKGQGNILPIVPTPGQQGLTQETSTSTELIPNMENEATTQVETPCSEPIESRPAVERDDEQPDVFEEERTDDGNILQNEVPRIPREAALRAKEKIALWTKQLITLL